VTFTKQMSVVARPELSVTVNMKLMDAGTPFVIRGATKVG